jgi:hypothetical protein
VTILECWTLRIFTSVLIIAFLEWLIMSVLLGNSITSVSKCSGINRVSISNPFKLNHYY